ncbi:tRNA uridine-5-carboxymethylaminomethyl(34) synthesis GTPase MnmE [Campylobacter fetus]|uniref:tRNA uridine-5-carboxymethylaminomethyl(34) synthesis GTPase MnmE n=1 Tax=Campylobacter fetus TaxID=196 RepID=UPI0003C29371|nr:tRNA uridine-5-carboxymethylaminomethyl(34) synthesis GTPase MnmE [Campylobacter fetus]AGZ81442.1 5-carboxymethylaminomethyluridine-tRNA synthase MnmEG, GTPase component [Campylobacter fetus subsp. testudinum 03-427]AJB45191.1 tRNA modification GTPase TrmE [Campylobacter fetus subsp. testudinum]AVK80863.1 tRNA uridine-5-carboxymethylaminomethyl(34) synthesis GTPase MnmE [Campylobacter fetus subsp. testudinum]EAI4322490.1 tRNA uridine-5-carboxymethylaminomethyl(34) synthesis GTPase MnmE [Camp
MNIVALASAYGVGSISIVRLSGENAYDLAINLCKKPLTPRYAHLRKLYCENMVFLDEAIVIYYKAPFSFTGEDVVEFQTHGGVVVANLIIDELLRLGARVANPGEFSKRAFLNGKMDLVKAESIQSLINARSEGAARILARTMNGELSVFVNSLRDELIKILAYTETCIDYADDDLPSDILSSSKDLLLNSYKQLEHIINISNSKKGLIDGYKVAIIGRPNVGKSSILNSLLHYERAITSETAGTTRDTIEEQIKFGSHLVRIIDTAGIRDEFDSSIEATGIEYSKRAAREADIIFCVFDSSQKASLEDRQILEFISNLNKKVIYVLNKSDLEFKFDINLDAVLVSAKLDSTPLSKELESYLNSQDTNDIMLSSNRQIEASRLANEAIKNAIGLLNESELELFAYELNTALKHIGSITKPMENSELLDKMFSSFCLGK